MRGVKTEKSTKQGILATNLNYSLPHNNPTIHKNS